MTRQILGLSRESYEYIVNSLTQRAIKSDRIDIPNEIADIELSDFVIMKVYDTDLLLDLGARTCILHGDEFREIMIR